MKMNFSSWNTHDWTTRNLELVPGHPLIQQACRACGRAFIDECSTGERYAVHISIFVLHRLSDEVTANWLTENCPPQRVMADEADRQTRFLNGTSRSGVAERASDGLDAASSPDRKIS